MSRRQNTYNQILFSVGTALGSAVLAYLLLPEWIALAVLAILFTHEYSHYFTALLTKAKAKAPVFLPFGFLYVGLTRVKASKSQQKKIALAGPIAGSAMALILMAIGLIYSINLLIIAAGIGLGFELYSLFWGSDSRKWRSYGSPFSNSRSSSSWNMASPQS